MIWRSTKFLPTRLGTAVLPIYTRHPTAMAQMAATNPAMAEQAAMRIEKLRQRAEANPPPFSAPGEFES